MFVNKQPVFLLRRFVVALHFCERYCRKLSSIADINSKFLIANQKNWVEEIIFRTLKRKDSEQIY